MDPKIVVEVQVDQKFLFDDMVQNCPKEINLVQVKKFSGDQDIIQAIIIITAATIPYIFKIVLEQIRSKKYIKLKHKGIEIRGVSEKNVMNILKSLIDKQKNGKK